MKSIKILVIVGYIFCALNYAECSNVDAQPLSISIQKLNDRPWTVDILRDECIYDRDKLNENIRQKNILRNSIAGVPMFYCFQQMLYMIDSCLRNKKNFFSERPAFRFSINDCENITKIFNEYFQLLAKIYNDGQINTYSDSTNKEIINTKNVNIKEFFQVLSNGISLFSNNIKNILEHVTFQAGLFQPGDVEAMFFQGFETLKKVFDCVNITIMENKTISKYDKKLIFQYFQNPIDLNINVFYCRLFYEKSELKTKFENYTTYIIKWLKDYKQMIALDNNGVTNAIMQESIKDIEQLLKYNQKKIKEYHIIYHDTKDIIRRQEHVVYDIKRQIVDLLHYIKWYHLPKWDISKTSEDVYSIQKDGKTLNRNAFTKLAQDIVDMQSDQFPPEKQYLDFVKPLIAYIEEYNILASTD